VVTISRVTAKLVIGLAAIATAGIIIYKVVYDYFVGPRKATIDLLNKLVETKTKFYTETIIQQEGALTAEQEDYLKTLNKRIDELSTTVINWGGDFSGLLRTALLAGIGIGFTAVILKYGGNIIKARNYVKENIANIRTSAGMEALMRSTINLSLAEVGRTSMAVAAQTSTEMWVTQALNPAMQSEIALLTAQMPTLVGTQLIWAQFMVSSLQFQMATAIPATLTAAWVLITPLI